MRLRACASQQLATAGRHAGKLRRSVFTADRGAASAHTLHWQHVADSGAYLVAGSRTSMLTRAAAQHVNQSVDPLVALNDDGIYRPGKVMIIHHPDKQMPEFNSSPKLTVLMCKSSHCKPCKKFHSTYTQLAERFSDCQLLEITGDESPETRKYMMSLKVKVTPSFFFWRNGQQIHTMTGTAQGQLRKAILERLLPEETGRDWAEPAKSDPCDD